MRGILLDAFKTRSLISGERSVESGRFLGYVVGVGSHFFLLNLVADDITFNGFQAMRIDDVTNIGLPHEFSTFVEQALERRRLVRPATPEIDLDSISGLLRSVSSVFPVVAIHQELVDPDSVGIGRVVSMSEDVVFVRAIGPDAVWDDDPTEYALEHITRIDFGGRYEEALVLVGGTG